MKLTQVFTADYMAKLDALSISINSKIQSGYSGIRKSNAKGNSIEFSDFRSYIAGDDIKRIDWNSYARLDKLFIKLYMEEKQANVNIFIDTSKSMDFGHVSKAFFSKVLAASISYISLKNMDNVNIFACSNKIESVKNNISSKNRFSEIISFLDNLPFDGKTKLNNAIEDAKKNNLKRGLSIILSDFFSEGGYENAIKILQYMKQDIILVHVLSKEEIQPELTDAVRLIDIETGETKDLIINKKVLDNYNTVLKNFKTKLNNFCTKRGIMYYFASTDMYIIEILNQML